MSKVLGIFKVTNENNILHVSVKEEVENFIEEYNLKEHLINFHNKIKKYFGNRDQYIVLMPHPIKDIFDVWILLPTENLKQDRMIMNKFDDEWISSNHKINDIRVNAMLDEY